MRGAGSQRAVAAGACDRGSGGVLALVVVMAAVTVALLVMTMSGLQAAQAKAASAADSAALAGATAVAGFVADEPCRAAAAVAEASGGAVVGCHVRGTTVTVVCEVRLGGVPVLAESAAGQPTEDPP